MPSAYTTLLGLVQPATGELSGTWGTTVNTQLTQLIEDAIAGYVTSDLTAADWTLSTTAGGAQNEARMAILIPTGTPGVARSIFAPKQSKLYAIDNRTNAVVTIKGGPGTPTTGVAIAPGTKVMVMYDTGAADFVLLGVAVSGPTGSAAVPSGTTAQRDATPQFGWQRANSTLTLKEWWNGTAWVQDGAYANQDHTAVAGGTADAITVSLTPAVTAFDNGPIWWRATAANATPTPTLQRNALAAKTLVKGNNLPLAAGDVPGAGAWMCSQYDVTLDKEVLQNPATGVAVSIPAVSVSPAVRQTVLNGPVDANGYSSFGGSAGSTTVTATGTLVPTAANGTGNRNGSVTNPAWTGLSTNGTMYLYLDIAADGTCTTGSTTLAPAYQWGGTYSTTAGQFTFNIQEMVGKVGNGSAAVQTYRVFVGEVTVAGSVVTAIVWYALMGRYDSGFFAISATTTTSRNHNIGQVPLDQFSYGASDSTGSTSGNWTYSVSAYGGPGGGGAWLTVPSRLAISLITDAVVRFMTSSGFSNATHARIVTKRGW